ncbi:MAG TPA: hypothetical protein VGC58_02160 [Candidatus Paceibacterota bacterium]
MTTKSQKANLGKIVFFLASLLSMLMATSGMDAILLFPPAPSKILSEVLPAVFVGTISVCLTIMGVAGVAYSLRINEKRDFLSMTVLATAFHLVLVYAQAGISTMLPALLWAFTAYIMQMRMPRVEAASLTYR